MLGLNGLATGIGSLPYDNTADALDLIFKCVPEIPFWPQLPKRDFREGMLAQFSQNFPCIKVTPDGIYFDGREQEEGLEKFYENIISNNLEYFRIGPDFAPGIYDFYNRLKKEDLSRISHIKCHVTGPFTFAAAVKNEKGIALLHDPIFMQVIVKGLVMKAIWQIKFFEKFGKKIIIFIDEPYLACFGSAYTPLNRQDVVKVLSEFTADLSRQGAATGVHCCGNTDWSIFTDIKALDIINFDAFGFLDKLLLYAEHLKGFPGDLCWGIVPTQEPANPQTADSLAEKVIKGVERLAEKGLDKGPLLKNMLISPACGLGSIEAKRAENVFKLLKEVSSLIRSKATG